MISTQIKVDMRNSAEAILRRIASTVWCQRCNQIVELLTVQEASTVTGTNRMTLLLWVVKERIHCLDLRGKLLICAASLERCEAVTGDLERRPIK